MKNRVNLYLPEFQPKLKLLTLALVFGVWCVTAILCGLIYSYLSYQHQQQEAHIASLDKQIQQQTLLMNELQVAVDNIKVDEALLRQVEQNQQTITQKERVLRELSGEQGTQTSGFSQLMLSLARHHQEGVWLTHINLDGTNIVIEGAASKSSDIPKWVSSLSQTDYFRGQTFADTRLYRDTDQQLNFVLATGKTPVMDEGQINE